MARPDTRRLCAGLVAGLNAARFAAGNDLVMLSRAQSYIGVMLDDLTRHGVTEPYRMFTSRAEFRLTLRADNASDRLTAWGITHGLVGRYRHRCSRRPELALGSVRTRLKALSVSPNEAMSAGLMVNRDGVRRNGLELLALPGVDFEKVTQFDSELKSTSELVRKKIEIEARYGRLS